MNLYFIHCWERNTILTFKIGNINFHGNILLKGPLSTFYYLLHIIMPVIKNGTTNGMGGDFIPQSHTHGQSS